MKGYDKRNAAQDKLCHVYGALTCKPSCRCVYMENVQPSLGLVTGIAR